MGALPNVTPRFKPDQYGRDPGSPSEKLRRRTNYAKGTGYQALFHAMFVDLRRLSRGMSCHNLVLAISALADRSQDGGGWTEGKTIEEWSELSYHTETKEFTRNRDYLKSRGMVECRVTQDIRAKSKALYAFRLSKIEKWQELEDYAEWLKKQQPKAQEVPDDQGEDDPAQNDLKAGDWRMSKPAKVARGEASKPYKIEVGIKELQFVNPATTPDGVDIAFFVAVKAGRQIVTPTISVDPKILGVQKAKSEAVKQVKVNPEDIHVRKNREKGTGPKSTLPPRGAELIAIFDPLLQKSASRLLALESSIKTLQLACDALGECPRNSLIEFLNKPGGRASRPIALKAVPGICQDARMEWERGKSATPKQQYSRAEIDAMVEKERAELAKKREELRRRK